VSDADTPPEAPLPPPGAPTEPVATPTGAPTEPTEPTPAVPVTTTTAAPARRPGVTVPVWALALVGGLLVFLVGGVVGYAIGDHDDGGERVAVRGADQGLLPPGFGNGNPFGGNGPFGNGDGRDGNGRDGNDGPGAPSVSGAYLGVAVQSSTDPDGAELVRVVPDGPAANAGLEDGDVVTKIGDTTIDDASALRSAIGDREPGDEIEVSYTRDGDSDTTTVTLGDRADATAS
jgi:membrane-associated protease RseP (regulator of RpoE activity)